VSPLAGCHLYPASGMTSPLAVYPINIFPLSFRYHTTDWGTLDLDDQGNTRKPQSRKEFLLEHVDADFKQDVRNRLEWLDCLAFHLGVIK